MAEKRVINQGAYSYVYRAPSSLPGVRKNVVIKRPNPNLSQQKRQTAHKNYTRQKAILDYIHINNPDKTALFNHIYQVGRDQQGSRSVMKDLGDNDLFTLIVSNPKIVSHNADVIIKQLIDVFLTLIETNIVHRDIKPENVMAQYNPKTKKVSIALVDFADSASKHEIEKVFPKFKVVGTYDYMSPELIERVQMSDTSRGPWVEYVANDLWSLGILMYAILYGNIPFEMYRYKNPEAKRRIRTPYQFYKMVKEHGKLDDNLFPVGRLPAHKRKYIKDIKALLSLDPRRRLGWLGMKLREKQTQKKQQSTLRRASSMIEKAQEQQQQKQLLQGVSRMFAKSQQQKKK